MLKNPTYSSTQSSKSILSTGYGIADRLNSLLRGGGGGSARGANKENASSVEKVRDAKTKFAFKAREQSDSLALFKSEPDASVSKAPSSLASSFYQAHGYLPQSDGAGKAHTASVSQHRGNETVSKQVRVNLPSSTAYAATQIIATPSACQDHKNPSTNNLAAAYLAPMTYGYDGGSDAKPSGNDDASKTASQSHPDFDYKGVTAADYEIQRESPDNEWHRGAVEDFFQEIAANERREIALTPQSSATGTRTS